MASPYIHAEQRYAERPWLGMAALVAVPLLSLVLVRMFWSGSSLWFLAVGIILIGVAGIIFLARRTQDQPYVRNTLAPDDSRLPLVLTGLGVLFLAMLVLPNYAGDGSSPPSLPAQNELSTNSLASGVQGTSAAPGGQSAVGQAPVSPSVVELPAVPVEPEAVAGETYVVQSGDTLWDISVTFGISVEEIVAANSLADEADISIGQELLIPLGGDAGGAAE